MSELAFERGALARLSRPAERRGGTFVVTDVHVAALLPRAFVDDGPTHVLAAGEEHKSWDALGALLHAMDEARLDRDGHVIAVGGGVVTDVAGLAASLHRRGVGWTAVPTTVVGQVDAAIGGKTAINLGGGKNTIGTFHAPDRVLVDVDALATLQTRDLRAGFAEVLKTAVIAGETLLARVERLEPDALRAAGPDEVDVIRGCAETKLAIVASDPHDRGARLQLNLGHTFGHAFEALCRPRLRHGEAVGLGMLAAARLAASDAGGDPDLEARLRAQLRRWSLPTRVPGPTTPAALLDAMTRDKKRADGRPRVVLPLAPGRVEVASTGPDRLLAALSAVLEQVDSTP